MTIDATLLLIAPELSSVDSEVRTAAAELAGRSVGTVFGDNRDDAIAYLTAHILTLRSRSGNGGAVQNVKEGDLSISYAGNSGMLGKHALGSTAYGQEYLRLRSQYVLSARTRSV